MYPRTHACNLEIDELVDDASISLQARGLFWYGWILPTPPSHTTTPLPSHLQLLLQLLQLPLSIGAVMLSYLLLQRAPAFWQMV